MTFPKPIKRYTEEPRIDPNCSVAILVLFRLYPLSKGRTGVGKSVLQVLFLNKVSLNLAALFCVSTYKSSEWAKQVPVGFIKLLIEWRWVHIAAIEKKGGGSSSEPRIFISDSLK